MLALLAAGCGGARHARHPGTTVRAAEAPRYLVGVVGPLPVEVQGVAVRRGRLASVDDLPLVLVDARVTGVGAVAASARSHPDTSFALVGASARTEGLPNLAGVVLDEASAARLAGLTAGLAAVDQGGSGASVAWVGPDERPLVAAFGRGVRAAAPGVAVLHQWTRPDPALCKEAALTAIDRGAVVVFAHDGLCADATAAAAHDQNVPALRLGDFLLPGVAAETVVRQAAAGVFHGGQDLVLGPSSGAVGIRQLDPRISAATVAAARAAAQASDASGG